MSDASTKAAKGRHLPWQVLQHELESGVQFLHPILGEPPIFLFVDPTVPAIGLRIPSSDNVLPEPPNELVKVQRVKVDGLDYIRLSCISQELFPIFNLFCSGISDRIQLHGFSFGEAFSDAVSEWNALLRPKPFLSTEAQTGLRGELWLFDFVSSDLGVDAALSCWKGPEKAEHDFALSKTDVEVKSTLSEDRVHEIGSLTQLVASPGRPLVVVSCQFTLAHGDGSFSLADQVDALRARAKAEGTQQAKTLDLKLGLAGWRDADRLHYVGRYRLRTEPSAILVDKLFPALTPAILSAAAPAVQARFRSVRYTVDVKGLGFSFPETKFKNILTGGSE
jgi:hypothetical protein